MFLGRAVTWMSNCHDRRYWALLVAARAILGVAMCLLGLCVGEHPVFTFVAAFNRDEDPDRAESREACLLENGVLCGVDGPSGGTWLGVNASASLFACVLNHDDTRDEVVVAPPSGKGLRKSRGRLLMSVLEGGVVEGVEKVKDCASYGGFTMIAADMSGKSSILGCSNRPLPRRPADVGASGEEKTGCGEEAPLVVRSLFVGHSGGGEAFTTAVGNGWLQDLASGGAKVSHLSARLQQVVRDASCGDDCRAALARSEGSTTPPRGDDVLKLSSVQTLLEQLGAVLDDDSAVFSAEHVSTQPRFEDYREGVYDSKEEYEACKSVFVRDEGWGTVSQTLVLGTKGGIVVFLQRGRKGKDRTPTEWRCCADLLSR